MGYTQGQTPIDGFRYTGGIGYIAVPSDIDRDKYIGMCFRNNRVSILTEDGGFVNQVPIDNWDLNRIEFPVDSEKMGSAVVYVTEQIHNHPIIVGVLTSNDEIGELVEGQWKIKKKHKDSFVEIVGSAKDGSVGITVDTDKEAHFYINVFNKDKSAESKVHVGGTSEYYTTGAHDILSNEHIKLRVENTEDEEDASTVTLEKEQVKTETKKFIINNTDEPFVLGKTFKDLFDNFIDEVAKTTVTTALGQMPILNAAQVAAFKLKTKTILSEKGFIDK